MRDSCFGFGIVFFSELSFYRISHQSTHEETTEKYINKAIVRARKIGRKAWKEATVHVFCLLIVYAPMQLLRLNGFPFYFSTITIKPNNTYDKKSHEKLLYIRINIKHIECI